MLIHRMTRRGHNNGDINIRSYIAVGVIQSLRLPTMITFKEFDAALRGTHVL